MPDDVEKKHAAVARVRKWLADPDKTATSVLAARMIAGEWVGRTSCLEAGINPSNLGQLVDIVRDAGYAVEERSYRAEGAKRVGKQFRVRERKAPRAGTPEDARRVALGQRVPVEQRGLTHPEVGSLVRVRAVILEEDGSLLVQLTNGMAAWTALVTGHVQEA